MTSPSPRGWMDLVFTPGDRARSVDGLLSGFHPPDASHLNVLRTVASKNHIRQAYRTACQKRYLAHELGDTHLIWRC